MGSVPPPGGQSYPPSGNEPYYPPPPYTPAPGQPVSGLPGQQPPVQGYAPQVIFVEGPPQLPPLVKGEKIKSGPYSIMVTDDMVRQRERENQELYRQWLIDQQRRNRTPEEIERDEQQRFAEQFKEVEVRRKFIRKVFCILALQLALTAGFIALVMFHESVGSFVREHWYISLITLFIWMFTYIALVCYESIRRQSPCNIICLSLMTAALGYSTAFISARYKTEIVLISFGTTAAIVLCVSFMAIFCKFDLTKRSGLICMLTLVIFLVTFVLTMVLIFTRIRILQAVIGGLLSFLISVFLYFDIQMIMGGRSVELNPDEIVLATAQLYVDIIMLYQYVLCCLGGAE